MLKLTLRDDCERSDAIAVSRCSPTCVVVNLMDEDGLVYAQAHCPLEIARELIDDLARGSAGELGRFQ